MVDVRGLVVGERGDAKGVVGGKHVGDEAAGDMLALGDGAEVAVGGEMGVERGAVAVEGGGVGGIGGEVVYHIGIGCGVVEFFGRLGGVHPRSDFAAGGEIAHGLGSFAMLHVGDGLGPGEVRVVVANVMEIVGAGGAHAVEGLIHAVATGEDKVGRGLNGGTEKHAAGQGGGRGGAGEGEERRGEVDPAHKVGVDGAGG